MPFLQTSFLRVVAMSPAGAAMLEILREAWPFILMSLLGLSGLVGLVALVSPRMFALVAETGKMSIGSSKAFTAFDAATIDIDQFVIKNSRQFGALVLMSVCYLSLFILGRIDPSWSPVFLLFIVGVSGCLALSGLIELRGQVSKIEHELSEARIDGLTGLANRRAFDEELERRLSEKSHQGTSFCLALLDIDHFKQINDKYGHLTGDTILTKGVAEAIRDTKRTMDLAARYGGDEFAIIFPSCSLDEATAAAERLRATIAQWQLPLEDALLSVTVSIGVAEAAENEDVESFVSRTDKSLYAAKQNGRDCACRHDGNDCQLAEETALAQN